MIATPAMNNNVNIPFCISLAQTHTFLKSMGIDVCMMVVPSSSLLVSERNRLLEAFWLSDCSHILCIDSDIGWPKEAVAAMIGQEKDFIAGVYPSKDAIDTYIFRPQMNENGSIVNEKHLLKMDYIPAGFMLLSRKCVQKMREKFPDLHYKPKDPRNFSDEAYCLFNTEVKDGEFWGEDYVFCRRAREAGIDIWVDPYIQFNHAGKIGMLMDCLTNDPSGKPMSLNKGTLNVNI